MKVSHGVGQPQTSSGICGVSVWAPPVPVSARVKLFCLVEAFFFFFKFTVLVLRDILVGVGLPAGKDARVFLWVCSIIL